MILINHSCDKSCIVHFKYVKNVNLSVIPFFPLLLTADYHSGGDDVTVVTTGGGGATVIKA